MDPRQQVLAVLVAGTVLLIVGLAKGRKRGRLHNLDGKIDYGFVLKTILASLAFSGTALSFGLTLWFIGAWGVHEDRSGAPPAPLESFLPHGYPVHFAMGLVGAGALCTFAIALIAYLDHINTG